MTRNLRLPMVGLVIDPWHHPFNGTVVSTRRFTEALKDRFRFKILLTGESDHQDPNIDTIAFPTLSVPGVNHIINSMQAPLGLPRHHRLLEALASCDLLHIQYPFFLAKGAIRAAREVNIPIVSSFHVQPENIQRNLSLNHPRLTKWLYRLFVKHFYQASDQVIAPSLFAKSLLMTHGVTRPIDVISNGVTSPFFNIARETGTEDFKLLSVGRLAPEKQPMFLLRAIGHSKHRSKISLTLAGTGPQEQALRKTARDLNIKANIGRVSDQQLHALYRRADLFVQCSRVELEGMSAMEAMAAGCPVLLNQSATSALSELVTGPAAGFKDDNIHELSSKIDALIESPAARNQLIEPNKRFIQTRHHDHSVKQLADLYERLIPRSNLQKPAL